eukprot:4478437-Alexandrium_andersonii.AAC.1
MPTQVATILGLADLLRSEPIDARRPGRDPPGRQAAINVRLARARRTARQKDGEDRLVPTETSHSRSPSVRPRDTWPCITHSNASAVWVGSRGRHVERDEVARAMGIPPGL